MLSFFIHLKVIKLLHPVVIFEFMESDELDISEHHPARPSLRVCVVTETYPPEVNGVAISLARVVEGLKEQGHHVWLVRPGLKGQSHPEESAREQWVRAWSLPIYREVKFGLPATAKLKRLWSRHRPDVVHIATEGPLGWSALRLALNMKLPVTTDFRTNFHAYSKHYRLGWLQAPILRYLKKFHNLAAATMVPTRALQVQLSQLGFERLYHVPRGVDLLRFDPAHRSVALRQSWGAVDETPVMICVSRLAAEKNLELVIRAWRQACQLGVDLRLVLVGDGPLRYELQARHPDVCFAGYRSGLDLSAHYASADLFAFASLTETFGNVTLEAMASGLPVLAFRSAGAAELIESGRQGLLSEEGEKPFIDACCQLVESRQHWQSMGKEARARAMQCDWPAVIAASVQVMRESIELQTFGA